MSVKAHRSGTTLLETILFLGILSIMSTTIVAVYMSTQEARVRQSAIAAVEQGGAVLVDTLNRTIREAETILTPTINATGAILTLQMATNSEFPTIVAAASNALILVQKTSTSSLLGARLRIANLRFRNINNDNVTYSFDLSTTIPVVAATTYTQHFSATTTLFPDDQNESGGCGTCPVPVCTNGLYEWYHCANGSCEESEATIAC